MKENDHQQSAASSGPHPASILIVKLRYLGDVLLATPVVQTVRAAYPSARITMIVNAGTEPVLAANPNVDEVLALERGTLAAQWRFLARLRRRRFDLAIDLTDGDRSAFLSWMSAARVRIGFNAEGRLRGRAYTTVVQSPPGSHRVERDLSVLRPLGLVHADTIPRIWLTADDEHQAEELLHRAGVGRHHSFAIIQPGARYWFKAWPPERFAALADRLSDDYGYQVLIGGTSEEEGLAQNIIGRAKSRPVSLTGIADIRTFAAVLKRARLFVGNDSGAMHLAAAVGTPLVALFGPSDPKEWGPRGGRAEILYKGLDCRTCFHPTCRRGEQNCMRLISSEEVVDSVRRVTGGALSKEQR
ncbi:MAG TPA: putative lipopolysaccharide heptosyltransferase III [Nitrospira sp.]|nr:putative lipopolysaccharide heptosyltransferase III [Nitrospira sp.]